MCCDSMDAVCWLRRCRTQLNLLRNANSSYFLQNFNSYLGNTV